MSGSASAWVVTADERSKHEATFLSLKPLSGRLSGEQAKKFFLSSNLPPAVLGQIWNLSDLDKDGHMTQQEFTIAMHLIQCKLRGTNLPTSLPLSLKTSSRGNVASSLLNPVENGFGTPSGSSPGWSSTLNANSSPAQSSTPNAGWSMGLTNTLPTPLLPANNQLQQSSAPLPSRGPSTPSMGFGQSFVPSPMSNVSSISMTPVQQTAGNTAMSSVSMSRSATLPAMGSQPIRQPVRTGSSYSSVPQQNISPEVSLASISSNSRLKFNQMFKAHDYEKTGFLTGEQSKKIFLQSLLPPNVLAQIWNLSDVDQDGQLSMEEFALGMHLVESAKSGKPLPAMLPANLIPQHLKRTLSESSGPVELPESDSAGSLPRSRSTSSSSVNDELFKSSKTFEDKRKMNFEKGRLELERRRQEMEEQRKRVKEEQERKERLEEERRQRAKLEAEQKRQAELDKQRQQQLEMEREQEALRKQMIQQRLQVQIEAERQRQLEWEKRKKEELLNHKGLEKDIVSGLQVRKDKLVLEKDTLGKKMELLQEQLQKQKQFYVDCIAATDALIKSRERKIAEIADIQNRTKLCNQQLPGLSSEQDRLQREVNKRDTSIMDESYGNALSSIEDTTCGIRRQVSNKRNLITELDTKKKMIIQLNEQLKGVRNDLQRQMDENSSLRGTLEVKKNDYQAMKQKQEEEKKRKLEEELKQRRESEIKRKKEDEARKQKEREMEAMRLERERQQQEQERRQKLQEQQRLERERQKRIQEEQQRVELERQQKMQEQKRFEEEERKRLQREEIERQQHKLLEQQRVADNERQRQLQLAQANEAKKQVKLRQEDLVNKDKIVQEQTTLLAKPRKPVKPPAPSFSSKADNEAEVRRKVQEMQKKRNEQRKDRVPSPVPTPVAVETSKKRKEIYRVIYAFDPRNPDEMRLAEGDIVAVYPDHAKVPPGWVYGACKDRTGLFPVNYAEKLPDTKGDYVDLNPANVPAAAAAAVTAGSSSQPAAPSGGGGPVGSLSVSAIVSALNSQDKLPIAVTMPAEEQHEVNEQSKTQVSPSGGNNSHAGATVFPEGLQATAIYQHRGKTENELTFNKNDVITVKEQKDMLWFGELNGKSGWFPKSFAKLVRGQRRGEGSTTEEHADKPVVQIPSGSASAFKEVSESRPTELAVLGECVALYAYKGEAGDLAFNEGDVISITKAEGDWWEGTLNGQKGIFPANYVKKKEAETSRSSSKRPEIATVTTAYTATSADQLSLVPGQYIAVKNKDPNGWWEGQLQARGKKRQSGWFPANCVKLLSSGSAGATPSSTGGDSVKSTDSVQSAINTPQDDESIYSVPISMKKKAETLDQVLAMFSYTAQNTDELTFYKGSVITVLNREGDWWQGELNGQVGMFPNNYVQPLTDLPSNTQ